MVDPDLGDYETQIAPILQAVESPSGGRRQRLRPLPTALDSDGRLRADLAVVLMELGDAARLLPAVDLPPASRERKRFERIHKQVTRLRHSLEAREYGSATWEFLAVVDEQPYQGSEQVRLLLRRLRRLENDLQDLERRITKAIQILTSRIDPRGVGRKG